MQMSTVSAFVIPEKQQPVHERATEKARPRRENITRLLCARIYLLGLFGGIVCLHRLLGPPLRSTEPGIGYDRESIVYHAVQSSLLSLSVLALAMCAYYASYDKAMSMEAFGFWSYLLVAVVILKAGVVNPWLARLSFREGTDLQFRIPVLGNVAASVCRALSPLTRAENTFYFKGNRPFIGYGTEINAWTVVIDTTAQAGGVEAMAGHSQVTRPLTAAKLYDAVMDSVQNLGVSKLASFWQTFVDGCFSVDFKRSHGAPFRCPPQSFSGAQIVAIDQEGIRGRRYLGLQLESPAQDLVATQFIRFAENGKLLFCEFASYVLPPGRRNLYWIDRAFQIHPVAYTLLAPLSLIPLVMVSLLVFPFVYTLPHLQVPPMWMNLPDFLDQNYFNDLKYTLANHLWPYAVVTLTLLFVIGFIIIQALKWLLTLIGIALGLSRQFGIAFSYRERFASRGGLQYYELQEVIRFLKTQEKILLHSLIETLKDHGIDTSDLRGVINSSRTPETWYLADFATPPLIQQLALAYDSTWSGKRF